MLAGIEGFTLTRKKVNDLQDKLDAAKQKLHHSHASDPEDEETVKL